MRLLSLALLLALAPPVQARERLVLVGGGDRPPQALARFVEWAGGPQARVLVVLWATAEPDESFASLKEDLAPHHPGSIERAPLAPLTPERRREVLAQLQQASAVFFSGGDQTRIMAALEGAPEVLQALRERYASGVVFGGTSAGTAVMSDPMITGEGDFTVIDAAKVEVKPGLGLLPGTIVDQHFVKRQRENRLFGLILQDPQRLGVGIEEDTALLVRDLRHAEVMGRGPVLMIDGKGGKDTLHIDLLRSGERFDLQRRKRVR